MLFCEDLLIEKEGDVYCRECGAEISDGSEVCCPRCGTAINDCERTHIRSAREAIEVDFALAVAEQELASLKKRRLASIIAGIVTFVIGYMIGLGTTDPEKLRPDVAAAVLGACFFFIPFGLVFIRTLLSKIGITYVKAILFIFLLFLAIAIAPVVGIPSAIYLQVKIFSCKRKVSNLRSRADSYARMM